MSSRKRRSPARLRVGKVSIYLHHGAWWLYYREHGKQVRHKVGEARDEAEQVAAQVNAQLTQGAPMLVAFTPVAVPELRLRFLDYHEQVLRSSVGTVRRYRAATQHLEDFVAQQPCPPQAHEVRPDAFAAYLRKIEVVPNGHKFVRVMKGIGHPEATCPKSWRHSYATLLQDANVDPLIRQQVMGHKPTNSNGLGMTANYTHTRGETLREQIERAQRR